jgi:hypothetical protein
MHILLPMLALVTFFAAIAVQERLLRLQYTSFRSEWDRDGQPVCSLSRSRSIFHAGFLALVRAQLARHRLALIWAFRTPAWMIGEARAIRLLSLYRSLLYVLIGEMVGALWYG